MSPSSVAARAQHVGGADIAGADRAQILSAREFGHDHAERDRAEQIADRKGDRQEEFGSHRRLSRTENQTCS